MGIFISRGMRVTVPPGGLVLSLTRPVPPLVVHVHFDVCPSWCELALQHLANAKQREIERRLAWAGTDEQAKGRALEREFEASMQAIVAAGIAIDAFYAVLQPKVVLPPSLVQRWRERRTARHAQISEILRRAFALKPKGTANLKTHLKEIFRFRDLAVHPSGKLGAPILHPELNVGVEWRFAFFRAQTAEAVVTSATSIIWALAHDAKPNDKAVIDYAKALRIRLAEVFPAGSPVPGQQPTP